MESLSQRSETMRAVKSIGTTPERIVRKLAHSLGFRFRLHRADLPGKPDLVFPRLRKVIFVHGCFWHGHTCKRGARIPQQNRDYWLQKITRNKARDKANPVLLRKLGWRTLIIWECETRSELVLSRKLIRFLRIERVLT
ncbi:MAG: DNA mismatch endonuclease Vsr [Bryobacter sp.]|jgi:DNA mismatch endonuclease (patch repair protein)|nr:DNA mismatch endonuclease Vsr [Bryobacter sp. CoA8 C33]